MGEGRWHRLWSRLLRRKGRLVRPGGHATDEGQGIAAGRAARDEVDEELAFHLEQRVRDYEARGLDPEAARAAALERLGDLERARRESARELVAQRRAAARRVWLKVSWLDFKLGFRMLVKYPGLTVVGGLGLAVGIAVGAGFFAIMDSYVLTPLPLDEGERVIGIESRDLAANEVEPRILHDFVMWRDQLKSVENLGAFRTVVRNLIAPDGSAAPVQVAEMTAAGFRVARVPPLLGRTLVDGDERAGAPSVIVIGYDAWQRRFAADPDIVGRVIQLGEARHTVVGVMPEGFEFPMNHEFWTPLRADPSAYERRQGPGIFIFGRLAPGVSRAEAQAELATIGRRTSAAFAETHERLRPRIVPFTAAFGMISCYDCKWEILPIQLLFSSLLIVIAVNVAILVYARTATRTGEIAVRIALGASRRRIVGQLLAEALVLSAVAAIGGLLLARVAVGQFDALVMRWSAELGGLPFWIEPGFSAGTVLYVLGVALLGAVIVGVVPGIQATGRGLQPGLREAAGHARPRLGRTWTTLIVAQVAIAVAFLPGSVHSAWEWIRFGFADPGFPAQEYLTAGLEMDRETSPTADAEAYERAFAARYAERLAELARRLAAEPGVTAVTFASSLPGDERSATIEIEGAPAPARSAQGHAVRVNRVDAGFFDAFHVSVLSGRPFHDEDLHAEATAVIVSRAFARRLLGGRDVLGRRIRYARVGDGTTPDAAEPGPWYEIVGVVGDLPANPLRPGPLAPRLYHPLVPGQVHPASLAVRVRGAAPATLAPRLREIATAVDPTLRAREVLPLDEFYRRGELALMRVGAWAITLCMLSVLLLSAAGVYALMSFTVTRRRREIGIRSALGANPRRLLGSIFSRALGQLALGIIAGIGLAALLFEPMTGSELVGAEGALILPGVAALMAIVGLLAALGPARAGLRIQPTEALREE